jgi:ABC-type multidrug transport system ATPase subunit
MNKNIFLLLLLLVIAAAGGYWLWEDQKGTLDETRLELYGNVDIREVRIAFDGNGHIDEIHVQEGDKVKQGQILARLKTARLQASLDAAEAGVAAQQQVLARLESGSRPEEIRKARAETDAAKATAKAVRDTYLRLQKLLDRKLASLEEVEDAVSTSETTQAQVRSAEATLALVLAGPRQEDIAKARAELRLREAERCNEVILMHQGKLLGQGEPADFSHSVAGRTFQVSSDGLSHRHLQGRLSRAPGVLDALIEGEAVRLVMETPTEPKPEALLPGQENIHITAVEPRFEDAFIARLKTHRQMGEAVLPLRKKVTASAGDEVIRVHNLQRRFGDFIAVKNISFSVRRGEIFGLLGANGAGKSTTFRMLCGLLPASSGELEVAGHDLRQAAASARGRIGYMAQKFSLYTNLSVMQNLRFFSRAYGLWGKQQKACLEWALTTFELEPFRNANAGDLPLGYKQRLSFAAALMHEPEILFLDEPTSGVDPLARREFWTRTNTLAEAGVTVLVTTHFMEEANYCDRLVIMAEGEVLTEGTPRAMKANACTAENFDPTMEDAFIQLIEQRQAQQVTT